MTKSGWSNSQVFLNYLSKHFAKYVKLPEGNTSERVLVLYDGHRSHISLSLAGLAKNNNVVLFVLPPHSSHVTQPLDVGVFGPFKSMYYTECQNYLKKHPGINISKYQVAELTLKTYLKAVSAENLISASRRTGIHPFNNKAFTDAQVAPAIIYSNEETATENVPEETEGPQNQELTQEEPAPSTSETTHEPVNQVNRWKILLKVSPQANWNLMTFFNQGKLSSKNQLENLYHRFWQEISWKRKTLTFWSLLNKTKFWRSHLLKRIIRMLSQNLASSRLSDRHSQVHQAWMEKGN